MPRGDRQEGFVIGVARFLRLVLLGIKVCIIFFVRVFKQFFRVFTPRAEVVLVKDDKVPVFSMDKLILGLNTTGLIGAQQVLEGTEHDNRLFLIRTGKLAVNVHMVTGSVLIGNKLPALKVHMGHKVFTPCRFHCRFEGQNKDALESHFLCKLIGCKGLAKAHLGIPKELRRSAGIFLRRIGIILHRALYRLILLRAHFEGSSTAGIRDDTGFQFDNRSFHIIHGAVKPFVAVAALVHLAKALAAENAVNILICENGTIGAHGRFCV